MTCFSLLFWRRASQLLQWNAWPHMPGSPSSINACSLCIWPGCCWVCPPVGRLGSYILHPHIISLQVAALYGMAAALSRVIGYWGDCFACGPFFPSIRGFLFFFLLFRAPLPVPLSNYSLARGCTAHTQDKHSCCLTLAFFRLILGPFFNYWLHTVEKEKHVNPFGLLGFLHKLQSQHHKVTQTLPKASFFFSFYWTYHVYVQV